MAGARLNAPVPPPPPPTPPPPPPPPPPPTHPPPHTHPTPHTHMYLPLWRTGQRPSPVFQALQVRGCDHRNPGPRLKLRLPLRSLERRVRGARADADGQLPVRARCGPAVPAVGKPDSWQGGRGGCSAGVERRRVILCTTSRIPLSYLPCTHSAGLPAATRSSWSPPTPATGRWVTSSRWAPAAATTSSPAARWHQVGRWCYGWVGGAAGMCGEDGMALDDNKGSRAGEGQAGGAPGLPQAGNRCRMRHSYSMACACSARAVCWSGTPSGAAVCRLPAAAAGQWRMTGTSQLATFNSGRPVAEQASAVQGCTGSGTPAGCLRAVRAFLSGNQPTATAPCCCAQPATDCSLARTHPCLPAGLLRERRSQERLAPP